MKLSTSAIYGLRAVIHLAENSNGKSYPLAEIAKKESLSLPYLEKIFGKLKKFGIVKAVKGNGGGYKLAKSLEEINMEDLLGALDGNVLPYKAMVEQNGAPKLHCRSHLMLAVVQDKFTQALRAVRLVDLVNHK